MTKASSATSPEAKSHQPAAAAQAMVQATGSDKAAQVQQMFQSIAPRYDLLNRVLSLGVDRRWRAQATRYAFAPFAAGQALRVLDVATGTADLALSLKASRPNAEVIGVDFAEAMLERGRHKALVRGLDVRLEAGDGLNLPYADASFDVLTIAYGLRNFADYQAGLQEFYRLLKPGGRLVVLEFPPPPQGVLGKLFRYYFVRILPRLGGILSGKPSAYSYLPQSVLQFPEPQQLAAMLNRAGFAHVSYRLQSFGISAMHVADKASS